MSKLKIGFVGVGSMGQCAHLRHFATLQDCTVAAVAEPKAKLRDAVARRYGVERTYPDAAAMLAAEQLDGIVASQPFDRHGSILPPLLASGIPLFTEKPLAASLDVGERLLTALQKSGTRHYVGYHKRSDPATMWAKEEIGRLATSGAAGKLNYVRLTMPAGDWTSGGFFDLIKTDEKAPDVPRDVTEGGSDPHFKFVNYYIHQVNLLRHLLGEPYRVTFADRSGMLLVAESASGITGTIELSPYTTKFGWQESALVAFEKGYVKLELPAPLAINQPGRVEVCTEAETRSPALAPISAMRQQAVNVLRALRGETTPLCEAGEALEDLKIARDYIRIWKPLGSA